MEVRASLEEFQKENTLKLELLEPSPPIQPTTWATPHGKIKINQDAIIDNKFGRVSSGTVARDSEGHVLTARSTTISTSIDPTIAEA